MACGNVSHEPGEVTKSWMLLWNLYSGNQEPPRRMVRLLESREGV